MTEPLWFSMGILTVLVATSARAWAHDLGLRMSWWKWLLAALWYGWALLTVAVPMTFVGERETAKRTTRSEPLMQPGSSSRTR